jgi:hypothetical protein
MLAKSVAGKMSCVRGCLAEKKGDEVEMKREEETILYVSKLTNREGPLFPLVQD